MQDSENQGQDPVADPTWAPPVDLSAFGVEFTTEEVIELAEFAEAIMEQAPPPDDNAAPKLFAAIKVAAIAITS